MIHVRNAIARAVSTVAIAITSMFDRSLDGLISTFTRLDTKLEAYIERKQRAAQAEWKAQDASLTRQDRAVEAERNFRFQALRREMNHDAEAARAQRIREKIADLIG